MWTVFSLRALAHANDIRSSAANIEDSAEQVAMVDSITTTKSLKLAPEKCASPLNKQQHSLHQFQY